MYIFLLLEQIIIKFCSFMYLMLLIRVLISWFMPMADNPITTLVKQVTDVILDPIRSRGIGRGGGFDFSYLIACMLISLIQTVLLRILYFVLEIVAKFI